MIVNPLTSNEDDLADCGVVAKALGRAGGRDFEADFKRQHRNLDEGRVRVTSTTGKLHCNKVMHLAIRQWKGYPTRRVSICSILTFEWLEI